MAKLIQPGSADAPDPSKSSTDKAAGNKPKARSDGTRETVESVVVAFILAFLVRTFEAEAFVIPTGSMAPTLYGRHIELECEQCGMHSVVGASSELDRVTEYYQPGQRITSALCPNCRYENLVYDSQSKPRGQPAFKGDRILVNKFPYDFWDPARWDVVVFKYPENPKTNYIKRLVGLPGEEIQIEWGDVYVRTDDKGGQFLIARKDDPDKQRQLQLLVYDNDRPARKLHEWGWPERWASLKPTSSSDERWQDDADGWQADYEHRTFRIDATDDASPRWIRYRHFAPTEEAWVKWKSGRPLESKPRPTLISDYCPYNAYTQNGHHASGRDDALWVGDLTINFDVEVDKPEGELLLELVEGVYRHRCRIDLKTGEATLFNFDTGAEHEPPYTERLLAKTQTRLKGSGRHSVSFTNVDRRLCLWIDGSLVDFGEKTDFGRPAGPAPTEADLAPVGIAAIGASVTISRLLLQRDIYYRADAQTEMGRQLEYVGLESSTYETNNRYLQLRQLLDDPQAWYAEYRENNRPARFEKLGPDEFFMMGDNSPHSQDSRLWSNSRGAARRHAVPRSALVGKAFFIYWPHGVPFLNGGRGYGIPVWPLKWFSYQQVAPGRYPENLKPPEDPYAKFTVPFYPNIFRMHRIR